MVLESTMICVDNSDYMRNGDFLPTRMFAQQDAVGMVFHAKTRSNPENNCGLICSADVKVISTLTSDSSKILTQLRALEPNGDSKFDTMIKMAHLALKHRQSKNHKMRIVAFVGSPVHCGDKDIVKLAKRLKKEKVNVDVVSFGEGEDNTHVLSQFVNTLNGKDGSGSHMVTVPTGPHLSDALISSPILQGEDGTAPVGLSTGSGFEFGVDPNEDPELAMALRVSMDEQRALQQQQQGGSAAPEGGPPGAQLPGAADTDDSMLQQTLGSAGASVSMAGADIAAVGAVPDFGAMTEEEQIAYAMRMSMADQGEAAPTPMETDSPAQNEAADRYMDVVSDPAFLQSVLESLPGVDPNSEEVRRAMGAHQPGSGASQGPEDEDNKPQDPKSK